MLRIKAALSTVLKYGFFLVAIFALTMAAIYFHGDDLKSGINGELYAAAGDKCQPDLDSNLADNGFLHGSEGDEVGKAQEAYLSRLYQIHLDCEKAVTKFYSQAVQDKRKNMMYPSSRHTIEERLFDLCLSGVDMDRAHRFAEFRRPILEIVRGDVNSSNANMWGLDTMNRLSAQPEIMRRRLRLCL